MAPKLLRELKGVNFSCTSPSSITTDDHQYSMLAAIGSSGRAIDRFSPHLRDPLRVKSLNPELFQQQQQQSQSLSKPKKPYTPIPKSSRKANGKQPYSTSAQLISPASSSRYLLGESSSDDLFELQPARSATVNEAWRFHSAKLQQEASVMIPGMDLPSRIQSVKVEKSNDYATRPSSSSSSSSIIPTIPQNQQVVVLRVSLHCKGCEGKVKKHISKMEGVTSFTTDLVNKKVTVIGDVTPLGVLNSISKVKNAQLWRSLPPTSSA